MATTILARPLAVRNRKDERLFPHIGGHHVPTPFWAWAALAVALLIPWPAEAYVCLPRDDMLRQLETGKYREVPVASGLNSVGGLMEIVANPETGTWTVLVTDLGGISCLVSSGENWRTVEPVEPRDSPA